MKQVVFSQVEATESGVLQIRFEKQTVVDGEIVARQYHRTALEPGGSLDAQMVLVNEHLGEMGYPPAPADAVERVRRLVQAEHTPERVAKFKADRERLSKKGG